MKNVGTQLGVYAVPCEGALNTAKNPSGLTTEERICEIMERLQVQSNAIDTLNLFLRRPFPQECIEPPRHLGEDLALNERLSLVTRFINDNTDRLIEIHRILETLGGTKLV